MVAVGGGAGRLGNATVRNMKELRIPHLVLVFWLSLCRCSVFRQKKDKNKEKLELPFSGQEFSPSRAATSAVMSSLTIGRSKENRID